MNSSNKNKIFQFRKLRHIVSVCLFMLFFVCSCSIFSIFAYAGQMSMTAIFAGRGDAILIESKGHYMLVDSGVIEESDHLISQLKSKNITKLDYIVSTHPDGDHVGGFAAVLSNFSIGEAFYSPCTKELAPYYNFIAALKKEGCPYSTPYTGQSWKVGDAKVEVLYDGSQGTTYNECSIVLKVTCDKKSVLLTGDLPSTMEKELMAQKVNFKCDVLKVAHHGAAASSCADFLDAASPSIAVISCDKPEKTNLPKDSVLQRLARRDIKVYRTSDGDVTINIKNGVISTTSPENNPFVSLKNASITLSSNVFTATGDEIKPDVIVTYNNSTVDSGFYTVSYSGNIATGLATVKVTGTETKFVSSISTTFKILPSRENIYYSKVSKRNRIKLKWNRQSHATGYLLQYSTNKHFKKGVKSITCSSKKTGKTIMGLKFNKKYYIRMRAYTDNVGHGRWSKVIKLTTDEKPHLEKTKYTKCRLTHTHYIKLGWNRQKLGDGYQLQCSKKKSFKKIIFKKTLKKDSLNHYTIKTLKHGNIYFIRVRAYKENSKKGKWSKPLRVRL